MSKPKNGYYSLIQYCPNLSRLETLNVGLIILCPEEKFLKSKITNYIRISKIFKVNEFYLNSHIRSINNRLSKIKPTFEELEHFATTRANDILITQPRYIKLTNPENDLEVLFKELVL